MPRGRLVQSLLMGGPQERGRRAGTENLLGIISFGYARKRINNYKIASPSRLVTPNTPLGSIFPSSPEGFMCVESPPLTPLAIFSFLLPASLQLESLEPLCRSKFLSVSVKPGGEPSPCEPPFRIFLSFLRKNQPGGFKMGLWKKFPSESWLRGCNKKKRVIYKHPPSYSKTVKKVGHKSSNKINSKPKTER